MADDGDQKYTGVSLPNCLLDQITEDILKKGGYSSRVDLVRDSIRRRLEEMGV